MWCCNTFWEKWVTLQVIPEQQKCFTDELCHCAWLQAGEKKNTKIQKKHVTAAGLCLSLYLATLEAKRGSLYFLGYCMLVALFYQLFMKKCERDILTEIKKEHIMKSYSQTLSRTFLLLMLHAKRRISVYIRLEGVTWTWHQGAILVSWLRACARVSEWVRACVRRIWGRGGRASQGTPWQRAARGENGDVGHAPFERISS